MQLAKKVQITVFRLTNTQFEAIGDISQFTSLMWPDAFVGYASFELWAPITEDNAELLKKDNILWCGGENAAIIESVKSTIDEDGEKTFNVKGRTLEKLLCDRLVWGTYSKTSMQSASTIMYELVDGQCIHASDPNRRIPYLENSADVHCGKSVAGYQKTGGEVYDALEKLAADSDVGFSILFRPKEKKLVFEVREGIDRTQHNADGNDPVVFSTELEDILSSEYYSNNEQQKTMALILGEGEGAARVKVQTGATAGAGFNRKELYVDARDLQSKVSKDDGTEQQLTPAQYQTMLIQRGDEKLAECEVVETFEAQIRQFGYVQYEFGVDYLKGDKITVIDKQLGISVSARITSVEEDFDSEYALIITFGYSYPTMLQKMRRMID